MADVFISYSRPDLSFAKALADDLKAARFEVWWDAELYAGDDFHNVIRDEIAKAKAVIVIWSDTAASSQWVRGEAQAPTPQDSCLCIRPRLRYSSASNKL